MSRPMPGLRTVALAILLVHGLCSSQPKLVIPSGTTLNFGDIWSQSAQRLVAIRNRGNDTLLVTNVSASCGCTGVLMSNDHIAPGDSGTLAITFDASRFDGAVEKYVSFESNDKQNAKVVITFHANIHKTLQFDPSHFYLLTSPDSVQSGEINIHNASTRSIRILSVSAEPDQLTLTTNGTEIGPGEDMTLTGTPKSLNPGTYRGDIVVTTNHPEMPRFSFRYFIYVKSK